MSKQQTLREPISYSGVGLHSGNRVTLTFLPAPPNSGIRFRRMDLEGHPEIEAQVRNVSETNRSTTLSKGNIKIHTVEHVLATFAGYGIDNVIVELDANEPPISDGSARTFCKMVETAGIEQQELSQNPFRVQAPLEFQLGESSMAVFPHDRLKISCTSSDKKGRFTQFLSVEISPEIWKHDLAPARTFCFLEEIEFLIKNGLIKGGSLENAVVIREDAVLTTEPLRFPDEFVRHKILDILGDLALLGRPLQGHVVAIKPSHAANCELARRLNQTMEPKPAAPFPVTSARPPVPEKNGLGHAEEAPEPATVFDIMEVMKILPHRAPFLMVDKVVGMDATKLRAIKNVTLNEPYFAGHFPDHPIMPGVLQLEAMAQAAGILLLAQANQPGRIAYFMSAEKVKWRKPVRPGDRLVIEVELIKSRGKIAKAKGVCLVEGDVVSEAEVALMLVE